MQQAMQQSQQMASTGKIMLEMMRYRLAMTETQAESLSCELEQFVTHERLSS